MNETQKKEITFTCTCNGCRNYPTRPAQITYWQEIASKTQGYFFSRESMKIFSSRVSDFKPVGISVTGEKSLAVIVSSRYGYEGAPRYYEVVILCPYGNLWRDSDEQGLVKYDSLAKARKSAIWTGNHPRPICTCHGCQLDEAGRGN